MRSVRKLVQLNVRGDAAHQVGNGTSGPVWMIGMQSLRHVVGDQRWMRVHTQAKSLVRSYVNEKC